MRLSIALACLVVFPTMSVGASLAAAEPPRLFAWLASDPPPTLIAYTPSQLDPRNPANQQRLPTSSIRADLETLRPYFDGLVLYGYHQASTPRVVAVAKDLGFRGVLLGIWDIKSADEIDGVARLAALHSDDLAIGVLVGNEGLTFGRYEEEDLRIAAERLRATLPAGVPFATSEPLVGYQRAKVREFGDFLAPNIHPVFDRAELKAEAAATWAREQAVKLARETGKPVLLKETGFPHAGKPIYTPATQRDFWSAYTRPGLIERIPDRPAAWVHFGVAFESFDLHWKADESKLEIEKSWGLFSKDRKPYPAAEVWKRLGARPEPK